MTIPNFPGNVKLIRHECYRCEYYTSKRENIKQHIRHKHNIGTMKMFIYHYDQFLKKDYSQFDIEQVILMDCFNLLKKMVTNY